MCFLKKILVLSIILYIFIGYASYCENSSNNAEENNLKPLIDLLKINWLGHGLPYMTYCLQLELLEKGGKLDVENIIEIKSNKEVIVDFEKFVKEEKEKNPKSKEILLFNDNYDAVLALYNEFNNVDFITSETFISPRFALMGDEIVFNISGIFSEKIFNTFRTNSNSRASEILETEIIPFLDHNYKYFFEFNSTNKIGLSVIYGTEDFSKDFDIMKAEILTFVVSTESCKKFFSGEITENEFINRAYIFLSDRNMVTKRIEINIE